MIKILIQLTAILLITFLVFFPCINNQFINWDDGSNLKNNPHVRSLDFQNIKRIFTSTSINTYVPLTTLSYAIEYKLFKYDPFIYHLDNLLLHLAVTALIFFFVLKLGLSKNVALITALLFGIHPMHVEPVAWISARKDVLYSLFYMLSLIFYLNYLENNKKKSYILTLVFGFLSIISKAMALSLPLILLLCDWAKGGKLDKKAFLEKIPVILYIIPITWITYSLHTRLPEINILNNLLTWIWTFIFYLRKFILPFTLIPLYKLPKPVFLFNFQYIFSVILLLIIIWGLRINRKDRWFIFAFLFYFLSIFFLLRFDDAVDICIVSDRFMYLPSLGFCILSGIVTERLLNSFNRKIVYAILIAIFAVLGLKTYLQCRIWKDNQTLWSYIIAKSPKEGIAYNNRGLDHLKNNNKNLALKDLNTALSINPNYVEAYNNRGLVYQERKQFDLALNDFNRAITLNPDHEEAYINRGVLLQSLGKYDAAFQDFNKAIEINPQNPDSFNNRAVIYQIKKEYGFAINDVNTAIDIDPNYIDAYVNRGNLYQITGQFDKALRDYEKVLSIKPNYFPIYYNRSLLYKTLKEYKKALEDALKAKSLGFNVDERYLNNLRNNI